jgi:hypothetical protein
MVEDGWSTPRPGRFIPGKETRYLLCGRLGIPQGWFGRVRKISLLPEFSRRTVQSVASRYNDCAPIFNTYLLTPWSRVLLEKLTVNCAASQEIPRICGTRKSLTVPTSARHLSLSRANFIQSPRPPPTSWRAILILSSHLRLGLPNGLFPSGFPTNTLCTPLSCPHTRHMPCPSHSSRLYHPHNIG